MACTSGRLPAEIVLLVCSQNDAPVLNRARKMDIETQVISTADFSTRAEWDKFQAKSLSESGADWVLLAGYTKMIGPQVLKKFSNRIINIHPSLLYLLGLLVFAVFIIICVVCVKLERLTPSDEGAPSIANVCINKSHNI